VEATSRNQADKNNADDSGVGFAGEVVFTFSADYISSFSRQMLASAYVENINHWPMATISDTS